MTKPIPPSLAQYWQQLRKPLELELARGCPDSAIAGVSLGTYTKLWADRLREASEADARLAQSLARGLRDYATMPVAERRRRALAALDLLRQREAPAVTPTPAKPPKTSAAPRPAKKRPRTAPALPAGDELLEMPLELLAPRAKWPKALASKLHLYTVRDLLYHIPRDWVAITPILDVPDQARVAVVGTVVQRECARIRSQKIPHPLYKYTLTIRDESGEAWVTAMTAEPERRRGGTGASWSPARLSFTPGQCVFALGKIERTGKLIELRMEDIYEVREEDLAILRPGMQVPLYPLTQGVYQSQVQRAVLRVLAALGAGEEVNALIDPLPLHLREQYALLPLVEALRELHRPSSPLRHEQARKRLAFEEFLIPQLVLARRRWEQDHAGVSLVFGARESLPDLLARILPFEPTAAQLRVLGEIERDLRSTRPMNRLLQGDVGSGKTAIAAGAVAFAVRSGLQAAVMAPTEILAEQLGIVLSHLLAPLGITPVVLTGSMPAAEKRAALQALASGAAAVAVGTHALIQKGVAFKQLGLAIIDEQHRFGVLQRAALRSKGAQVNALVMTATPIPRTLSLAAYGDLDVSVLDELPPGRHPVETRWVPTHDLPETYDFIRAEIARGRQAYILCPLVEQSDLLQMDAATEMAQELQTRIFPQLRVGLLHGRMRPEEKDAAMQAFRAGDTQLLACTTVVEVGVDVPNATVMLIHNAERFGLSQLHQLRGRVGRSQHQSYCLLATHPRYNPQITEGEEIPARRRLRIMQEEQDGFAIAEADLELRGPGEYLGTRQSGLVDFKIGHMLRDAAYLEHARQAATALVGEDPDLTSAAHAELRRRVRQMKARLDQFRE